MQSRTTTEQQPTPTQAEADALKLQAHGADATDMPPAVVDVPHVTGAGAVGSTLNCTMGNWTNEPTSYAYQWQAGAASVGTGDTYVISETDVGSDITCVVTAANAFGSTTAPPSNAITATATSARGARAEPPHERAPAAHTPERGTHR